MNPAPPPPPNPNTDTATSPVLVSTGMVGAVIAGANAAAKWTAQQLVTVIALLSLIIMYGIAGFLLYDTRNDRQRERQENAERAATLQRGQDDARERDRQLVASEQEKGRQASATLLKEILAHCAGENEKARAYYATEFEKTRTLFAMLADEVRRALRKVPPEEEGCGPAVAPVPRPAGAARSRWVFVTGAVRSTP